MSWSKLEAAMGDLIWMFLDVKETDGRLITKRLNTDGRIQLLRGLAKSQVSDKAALASFLEMLEMINELSGYRNTIAHSIWSTLMPDDIPTASYAAPEKESAEVISETFSTERMETIISGVRLMIQQYVAFPANIGKPRRVPPEQPRA